MVRVLLVTPVLGHPPSSGPDLSAESCIKALGRVSDLHVISRVGLDSMGGVRAKEFYEGHCADFVFAPSVAGGCSANKYLSKLERRWIRLSRMYPGFGGRTVECSRPDVEFILEYAGEHSIDVVWCDRGHEDWFEFDLIRAIKKKRPYLKVVCDTEAVFSKFILRGLPYAESPRHRRWILETGKSKQKVERILVNLADVTTAVSEVDADYFRSLTRTPDRVRIFSNVVDVETYRDVPPPPEGFRRPSMYLAGWFGPNSPMADAARWTVANVLPLVRRQVPDIHFYIAGSNSDRVLSDVKDPDITITGKVPSVLPYLCHTNVALVPLRFESGTRFKILEAGACGTPVVSTTLGAEGIPVIHEKDILIADDPEPFADCVVRLVRDQNFAKEIGENLKKRVEEHHSIAALAEEGRTILESLLNGSLRHS